MKALDTNVLVRYLTQDEPGQVARVNSLISGAVAKHQKLHLDVIVLCELVWVLRGAYRLDRHRVANTLEKLLDAAQFSIQDRDIASEALAAYQSGAGDFADYVLGSRNRRAGCRTTLTFDRALKKSDLFSVL